MKNINLIAFSVIVIFLVGCSIKQPEEHVTYKINIIEEITEDGALSTSSTQESIDTSINEATVDNSIQEDNGIDNWSEETIYQVIKCSFTAGKFLLMIKENS